MSNKIAVVGLMHSGKSTLAKLLVEEGYQRIAFADPVKDISAKMLTVFQEETSHKAGVSVYQTYNRADMDQMKGHPSIRSLLQLVGTELGRNWKGPDDIWVQWLLRDVATLETREDRDAGGTRLFVNDDCRFANEAQALIDHGWTVIRLKRDETVRKLSVLRAIRAGNPGLDEDGIMGAYTKMMAHPSEAEAYRLPVTMEYASESIEQLQTLAKSLSNNNEKEATA